MTVTDTTFLALQEALAGRYSLERELGRGGMGIVYLAPEVALRDAVTALETVRLNLLRMHAGVASVQSVTADLEAARDVSDAVARLAQGHEEVDRTLSSATGGTGRQRSP